MADDFVENVAAFACELVQHRGGKVLEAKDVQLALGAPLLQRPPARLALRRLRLCITAGAPRRAEKNWDMRLPGVGDLAPELKSIRRQPSSQTEVHRQRLQLVRRSQARENR